MKRWIHCFHAFGVINGESRIPSAGGCNRRLPYSHEHSSSTPACSPLGLGLGPSVLNGGDQRVQSAGGRVRVEGRPLLQGDWGRGQKPRRRSTSRVRAGAGLPRELRGRCGDCTWSTPGCQGPDGASRRPPHTQQPARGPGPGAAGGQRPSARPAAAVCVFQSPTWTCRLCARRGSGQAPPGRRPRWPASSWPTSLKSKTSGTSHSRGSCPGGSHLPLTMLSFNPVRR